MEIAKALHELDLAFCDIVTHDASIKLSLGYCSYKLIFNGSALDYHTLSSALLPMFSCFLVIVILIVC